MAHGVFVWSELMTNDVEAAKAFFAATVGWTFVAKPTQPGTYWLAQVDGKPVAGIMDMNDICQPGVPPHWLGIWRSMTWMPELPRSGIMAARFRGSRSISKASAASP